MKDSGIASKPMASSPSATSSSASCDDLRPWVAAEAQIVRECIPGPTISDQAAKIMLDALEGIAREIGRENFHAVAVKIIETCERRPTIATYRKLAGLTTRLSPQDEALAAGWELITMVVTRFLAYDAEGNVSVRPRIAQHDGKHFEEMPPKIPDGVRKAVMSLGGWKLLASSYPEWWGAKFQAYKEMYRPTPEEVASLLAPATAALTLK